MSTGLPSPGAPSASGIASLPTPGPFGRGAVRGTRGWSVHEADAGGDTRGGRRGGRALLAGCGGPASQGGDGPDPKPSGSAWQGGPASDGEKTGATGKPEAKESTLPGALPSAYEFTPNPDRVPKNAAQARKLTRGAALGEADWTAGTVRHTPYESGGSRPVLPDSCACAWTRSALPSGVLDSFTRRLDIPARNGKGRVQGAVTVTAHRSVAGADQEIKDTDRGLRPPRGAGALPVHRDGRPGGLTGRAQIGRAHV